MVEILCLLGGGLLGLLVQKCFAVLDGRKNLSRSKDDFLKVFNRLAIHCFVVGGGLILLVILFGGGVGKTAELFIGGFLITGCIWCWVVSVREKRPQTVAVEAGTKQLEEEP